MRPQPQCVDISERIAELTLPHDQHFVKLQDRKRALKLVTHSHLGLVSNTVSNLVLHSHPPHNGRKSNGAVQFSKDQIKLLRDELTKIDKQDEEYIREPAPNLNMLSPQGRCHC